MASRAAVAVAAGFAAARDAVEAVRSARQTRRLHEFADVVSRARASRDLEADLVRVAGEMSGACFVELVSDRDERPEGGPRRLAAWPETAAGITDEEVDALGYPLALGMACGAGRPLSLRLYARPGSLKWGRWPAPAVRRLTTLCALAAAAERGMSPGWPARAEVPAEPGAVVRDATYLTAVLPYALAQARRHREAVTVFCVEVDALPALVARHGVEAVERGVARLAEGIALSLRSSDLVARLDDSRVVVMLPGTGGSAALKVADVVRSAIAGACPPSGSLPGLTASLGVACYPDDARDVLGLLSAADEAMTRARAGGPNRLATAGTLAEPDPEALPMSGSRRGPASAAG